MKPSSAVDQKRHRALTSPASSLSHAMLASLVRPELVDPQTRGLNSSRLQEFLAAFLFPDAPHSIDEGRLELMQRSILPDSSSQRVAPQALVSSSTNPNAQQGDRPGPSGEPDNIADGANPSGPPISNTARWQLADAARAKIQDKSHHASTAISTNGGPSSSDADASSMANRYIAAQDNDQRQFFSRKYTEAIDRLDRLVSEHQREKERWEVERGEMKIRVVEAESKLEQAEAQLRFMKDKTKNDIERCTKAEQAVQEMRRDRDQLRKSVDELQFVLERKQATEIDLTRRNKDLQGQLDHLQGKSTVPFPSLHALEDLQSKNNALDAENTRLTTELGRRAVEFTTKLKEVMRERDAAVSDAATLRARVADLERELRAAAAASAVIEEK